MKRRIWLVAEGIIFIAGMGLSHAAQGDFELTAPDGRRLLLKDNGTWRYLEAKGKEAADDQIKEGELILTLERKMERGSNCRFGVRLTNNVPYEVGSLVLYYSAYRANGVMYDTVSSGFVSLKPGNTQTREIEFAQIPCQAIVQVRVAGGDRCEMGDLNKWSYAKGECLARVRVMESDLVRFEK
ncbi:MAG TPA: hypothetical protein VGG82_08240 [Casimicrobiaceae bacterium]|jgi:hypothetical protein